MAYVLANDMGFGFQINHGLNLGLISLPFRFFGSKGIQNWLEKFRLIIKIVIVLLMYKQVYQKSAYFLSAQMADLSRSFSVFIMQWTLDLRKILVLKSRFFLISNTRKPLKRHNFAKMNIWNNTNVLLLYHCQMLLTIFVDIFIP